MDSLQAARKLRSSPLLRRLARLCPPDTFLTGGSLRDRLLSLPTHDFDLVVTSDAETAARRLAQALGGSCFPLGKPPRVTWRVVAASLHADIWQPKGEIEGDIRRRDFTINAIFWRLPDGPLVDLVGGLADLEAGRIRIVSEANLRSDPLRVLRALRLLATRPRLRLTAEGETQLARAAPGLARVARERIVSELFLLLAGPAVARALATAARLHILAPVVPGWSHPFALPPLLEVASRLAARVRSGPGRWRRELAPLLPALLAAPAAGFPERWDEPAAAAALTRAGWPPRTASHLAAAVATGERFLALGSIAGRSARAQALDAGPDLAWALGWFLARHGEAQPSLERAARRLLQWEQRARRRPLPLDGQEVAVLLGLSPGPERGRAVELLRRGWALGSVRRRERAAVWLRQQWRARAGDEH